MSIDRARKALKGETTDRIPLFDMPGHPGFLKHLTGIDVFAETEKAVTKAIKELDVDMLMCRVSTQTNASKTDKHLISLDSTRWRNEESTIKDIFSYDPLTHRDDAPSWSEDECVEKFQTWIDRDRRLVGDTSLPIGYSFTTCIHYAAEDLNWSEFLMACITDEDKVSKLLDKFQAASEKVMRAWSRTDAEVILCHDDIANSISTNLSPAWLRKNLIHRYKEIFKPIKEKGVPTIFMTDGNYIEVAEDLLKVGADGFFLDAPCIKLKDLVSIAGRDLIYFTGPSPATMTVGSTKDVYDEMEQLANIAQDLPRFFFHVPGGYTHNMPLENVIAFYDSCKKYGQRSVFFK